MENNFGKVSFNSPSLKNLLIGTSNVEHTPTSAFVIECRDVPKRNEKNEVIDGTISKKVLLALQSEIVKAIQEVGGDLSSIKPFTIEIYNDESFLKKINNELIIAKTIDLEGALLALKWVSDGRNGGAYREFKLIISEIKLSGAKS
ncbi:hypothetical protein [Streptococcus pneumoniae]|uniref:Uncharacterized protein n=1 Tax=Streptococcus pneumoniae TaxID=1313 RepID=A0A064C0Q8_STREE|nr:hypothetical protein [Streptococcus pneumoniae]EPD21601.1 hypothetical protein SP6UMMC_01972 [Streptococcus pneumoniae MNZ41]ETE02186.1 hypothetical protein U756_06160 [Streptococcus pneumoniae 27]AJD71769.1 hypothetical protein SpnNT_00828 [Streptococcus pneumoniae]EPF49040.1 hypothetical protein SP7UMMC_06944 [Streptococcus pneumoniae MNZ85]KDE93301.1 hypothetical protein DB40_05805 [Streptococcus pneumoniae]